MKRVALAWIALLMLGVRPARADFLFYQIPGSQSGFILQGTTKVNPGKTVTYRHPKFGSIYFRLDSIRIIKSPSTRSLFERRLGKAVRTNSAENVMAAARWGLKRNLVAKFVEGVDKALELDPNYGDARRVKQLLSQLDRPIPSDNVNKQVARMRTVTNRSNMKVEISEHFILLHDTPDKPREFHKLSRAKERLQLLEQVYDAFMLTFYSQGIALQIPQQRLMVVLFNEYSDYRFFAEELSPALVNTSGFYSPSENIAFFFDHSTHESFQQLKKASQQWQNAKAEAVKKRLPGAGDIRRLADSLRTVVEISQENSDIEVVSHEATHQLASNTGLFPRHTLVPKWVHEGLATYFEAPDDAAWGGIGAVNQERLQFYKALARDRQHSNLEFIVSDNIFGLANTHMATLHAYGQAWALTHFLMERHFDKLMQFYKRLGQLPPDVVFNPQVLEKIFKEVFGQNLSALDSQWRVYMQNLKTTMDEIREEL